MARLIAHPDTPRMREIPLKDGINTVGRGETNDVVISDPSISGRHCEVTVAAGAVQVKDLGSTNGTFVNRVPVTETILRPGQKIHFGAVELVLEGDAAPVQTQAPANGSAVAGPPRLAIPLPASGRLRVTAVPRPPAIAIAEAPPELPPVPLAPAPPPVAVADIPTNAPCKYHPKTLARWGCMKCHKAFCDLCVTARPGAGPEEKTCRSCGGVCAPLQVRIEAPPEKNFFRELPRAVIYPFRGKGVLILIVATLLFAALDIISSGLFGLIMKAVALGYLFSYVQNIIHSTAAEDEQMPDLPAMDDLFGGFLRLAGTVLVSFGPALVLAYFAIFQEQPMAGIALIPAVIFGCLYFPMAFLVVAIKDDVMAANPLIVVPSILRVPLEYIVTAILLAGLFGVRWLGDSLSSGVAHRSMMTSSMTEMFLLFGFRAIWAFVSVYLLTVNMRILGLLYLTKRDRLGW